MTPTANDRPIFLAILGIVLVVAILAIIVCAERQLARRDSAAEALAKVRADRQEVMLKMLDSLAKSVERFEAKVKSEK